MLPTALNRLLIAVATSMAMLPPSIAIGAAGAAQTQSFLLDAQRLQQTARQHYDAESVKRVQAWLDMLAQSQNLAEIEKIRVVNDFWNQSIYSAEDIDTWGRVDYWATPLESLGRGRGDCEDYVIGKYFSLVALDVPVEKLRFFYVRYNLFNPAHMVLGYYSTPDAVPLVLDNLLSRIEPANNRRDLTPVFSFNASRIYIKGKPVLKRFDHSTWNDLLLRMKSEGFG